jgi:hypothetical protein
MERGGIPDMERQRWEQRQRQDQMLVEDCSNIRWSASSRHVVVGSGWGGFSMLGEFPGEGVFRSTHPSPRLQCSHVDRATRL